ncbi:MAG: hypothetical protein DWQ19_10530 [Crenarchaeota archaeon]|nr:MAG: hypothetical protein DWQ19_10530 [Thermoproteota archaeon]
MKNLGSARTEEWRHLLLLKARMMSHWQATLAIPCRLGITQLHHDQMVLGFGPILARSGMRSSFARDKFNNEI